MQGKLYRSQDEVYTIHTVREIIFFFLFIFAKMAFSHLAIYVHLEDLFISAGERCGRVKLENKKFECEFFRNAWQRTRLNLIRTFQLCENREFQLHVARVPRFSDRHDTDTSPRGEPEDK